MQCTYLTYFFSFAKWVSYKNKIAALIYYIIHVNENSAVVLPFLVNASKFGASLEFVIARTALNF